MTLNNLPSGWDRDIFSNVIDINRKYFIKRGTPAKYVEMKSLLGHQRNIFYSETRNFSSGTKFKQGDTLFAKMKSCLENGKTAYCSILQEEEIGWGSTEFLIFSSIPSKTDNKYIYYLSKYETIIKHAVANANGTDRQRVPISAFDNLILNLPPLQEQKRIGEILGTLDDKIEINKQINNNLESIAQIIFKNWFVHFKPFKQDGTKKTNLGSIPQTWGIEKISEISKVITGKTPPTKVKLNYGDKYKFIKIPDMHNNLYITKTKQSLSEEGNEYQPKQLIPANSLCVSCIATVGLVSIISEASHTNQQINSIICKENLLFYLYFFFKSHSETLKQLGSGGTATLNVNKSMFENIKIIMPPPKVLDSYTEEVKPLFQKIKNNYLEIDALNNLRDSLLPKLMSGDIRV
ncbi:MAG: restriction endonuclease subunit S [Gammaproteobacteria bacterium]|nr:restriction endonuclease subunit S [Gammaproteobacteria bacterium]